MDFKIRKILFLETTSDFYSYISNMYSTLGKFCDKIIAFNRRGYYFKYGKRKMNEMLLDLIKRERPDYIFTWLTWDEFYPDTLLKIREISPNTKTVAIFGDDIHQFEDFSRYYSLLFDYSFTTLKSFIPKYKKEGINSIFLTSLTSINSFYPMGVKKIYDVTFIGTNKGDDSRFEFIKFLKDNGINIKLFGFGWNDNDEFKGIYGGPLDGKDMVKVINQTKINLCFSKNDLGDEQMKAKIFELGSCKSFTLCEYARDYIDYFKEDEEIVFFRNKEELLEKVKYFLGNEDKRQVLIDKSHQRVNKEYSLENELKEFFIKTCNDETHAKLPAINGKSFLMKEEDFDKGIGEIEKLIDGHDYISFLTENSEFLPYKEFFQIYSLEKTSKNISCCNYYLNSKSLGDYMLFFLPDAINKLGDSMNQFLDLSQILVRKKYFIDNFDNFKRIYGGGEINFINKEECAVVNIPLVRLRRFKLKDDYEKIKLCYDFKYIYKLNSLLYQKKYFSLFPWVLFMKGLLGESYLLKAILNKIKDKNILERYKAVSKK